MRRNLLGQQRRAALLKEAVEYLKQVPLPAAQSFLLFLLSPLFFHRLPLQDNLFVYCLNDSETEKQRKAVDSVEILTAGGVYRFNQ